MRGPEIVPTGAWTHLATTYDGSALSLYLNGDQVASQPVTGAMLDTAGPLRIGGNAVWPEWFAGAIDELRVYDRALTAAELQIDMRTPVAPPPAADTQPPTDRTGLVVGDQSQTSVTLTWNLATDDVGVAGYGSYRDGTLRRQRRRHELYPFGAELRHELRVCGRRL